MPVQLEENMYRAFHHFDSDGSGTISKEELREALKVGCTLAVQTCDHPQECTQDCSLAKFDQQSTNIGGQ